MPEIATIICAKGIAAPASMKPECLEKETD